MSDEGQLTDLPMQNNQSNYKEWTRVGHLTYILLSCQCAAWCSVTWTLKETLVEFAAVAIKMHIFCLFVSKTKEKWMFYNGFLSHRLNSWKRDRTRVVKWTCQCWQPKLRLSNRATHWEIGKIYVNVLSWMWVTANFACFDSGGTKRFLL